jgi:hypothetical protein
MGWNKAVRFWFPVDCERGTNAIDAAQSRDVVARHHHAGRPHQSVVVGRWSCEALGLRGGDERLSDSTGNDSRRTTGHRDKKNRHKPKSVGSGHGARSKPTSDVGRALRSVYDTTLGERVPDDFLDLLGKLS